MLKDYLVKASKIYYGLSPKSARELAYQYAVKLGKSFPSNWTINKCAGEDWLSGFLKRFTELSLRKPKATSLARATSFNKHNVSCFFDKLEECLKRADYSPSDIYNADETGCTTVQSVNNAKVVACRNEKQVGKLTSGERGSSITVLYAANAAGNAVPPMMVFPRVNFKQHMMKGAPPGAIGVAIPSGWMSAACFTEFMKHFIKYVKCSKDHPVVRIFDNHDSHISIETIDLAKDNGATLLTLPPHCSHKLQPLDRSVYGPFKSFYNQAANGFMVTHPGKPITIYDVAELVGQADGQALTPRNIRSGFAACGIWPFNRDIFREDELLSSYVSDRPHCSTSDHETPDQPEDHSISSTPSTSKLISPTSAASEEINNASISYPITPEAILPLPQCTQSRKKSSGRRKKRKSQILTDSPIKNAIAAEKMQVGKKRRKLDLSKKKKQFIRKESESNCEEEEALFVSDESDVSVCEDINPNYCDSEDPKIGDFVLCKFPTKKGRTVMYVGRIDDVGEEFEVNFLRKSRWGGFTFPDVPDICDVIKIDVVLKLPTPQSSGGTSRAKRQLTFPVDLSAYAQYIC